MSGPVPLPNPPTPFDMIEFMHTTASFDLNKVPVGDTGTIPFSMRNEKTDYPGAICDSKRGAGDGNRWWYINSTALKWATSQ